MGACSSKPKTKESDASMEPQKPAEFATNQQKQGERSLDKVADDSGKDALIKLGEEGEAAQPGIVQMSASGLDASNGEPASKPPISGVHEDVSELRSDVLAVKEPICKAISDEIQQNEKDLEEVSDGTVKKHDGDGAYIVDNSGENEGKEVSLADEAKTCENKAVVSEEAGGNQEDDAYTDKKVALDEGKSSGNPVQRNPAVPGATPMVSTECDSFESPIVGAAQHVESKINGIDTGHTKNAVADLDIEGAREGTCKDTRAVTEDPDALAGNVGVDVKRSDDLGQDSLESGGEGFVVRMPPPGSHSESPGPLDDAVLPKDGQDERASKSQEAALSDAMADDVSGKDGKGRTVLEGSDARNRKMQVLIEKDDGEGRSIGMLGDRAPDSRKESNGQGPVSKSEGEKPTFERQNVEHISSGNLAFEDASDGLEPIQQSEAQCN